MKMGGGSALSHMSHPFESKYKWTLKAFNMTNIRTKQRFDTLANWESNNIVLLAGELAIVDCGNCIKFKVGNGLSTFN